MDQIPNTNSTILSQLFKYRIIWSNSESNHLVKHKYKVKLLFFAVELRANIHQFPITTLTKPRCLLF